MVVVIDITSHSSLETAVGPRRKIELLIAEVSAFATELKQATRSALAGQELLPGEASVLQILEELGPKTVPQIAKARSTSRQNIQVLVNRLIAEGCLEANRNPAHKLSALIVLTVRGKELLATATKHEARIVDTLAAMASAEKVSAVAATEVLRRLRELLIKCRSGARETKPATEPKMLRSSSPLTEELHQEPEELPVSLL